MSCGARWAATAVALAGLGCQPTSQLLLYFTTDAPLPPPPGTTLAPGAPWPLFERAHIEVFSPGAEVPCAGCTHEFDVDAGEVDAGRASIGIALPPGVSGYRVRARLVHSPAPGVPFVDDQAIVVYAALPPAPLQGVVHRTLIWRTSDTGRSSGSLANPVETLEGPPPRGLVGSWPDAQPRPCSHPAPDGFACVPGGAYWMGNPLLNPSSHPRIAVLSPFFLARTETTIGHFARLAPDWTGGRDPRNNAVFGQCTLSTHGVAATDPALPVNCISWGRASAFCQSRLAADLHHPGADLPTEAQLGYAESRLGQARYVWGDDLPSCDSAVWGLAGSGFSQQGSCRLQGSTPVIPRVASVARDQLALAEGGVFDLEGSVSELTSDQWNDDGEPEGCWAAGVTHDPRCDRPSPRYDAPTRAAHGGQFASEEGALLAALRAAELSPPGPWPEQTVSPAVGFRCVLPDLP